MGRSLHQLIAINQCPRAPPPPPPPCAAAVLALRCTAAAAAAAALRRRRVLALQARRALLGSVAEATPAGARELVGVKCIEHCHRLSTTGFTQY